LLRLQLLRLLLLELLLLGLLVCRGGVVVDALDQLRSRGRRLLQERGGLQQCVAHCGSGSEAG